MTSQTEIEQLQQAILALEAQRTALGDQIVDTALAPLREKLTSLESTALGEQRKLITVLFADLVDFTALSTQIDSEELRDLLNKYFSFWSSFIQARGGVVEKFIGDAVMAVFGMTASREDDPERAILAALDMRAALEQFNQKQSAAGIRPLAMRVGIHTGPVLIGAFGERQKDEFVAVGETVNLTSRLQAAAPVNGILITQDTYRHIRGLFAVQPYENLQFKGISEQVQTYLIESARPRTFRRGRRGVEGVETSLVGRAAELSRMQVRFWETIQTRRQHMLLLVGEAGIGKSRLLTEFETWLSGLPEAVHLLQGRAFPTTQTTPFFLARAVLAHRFGINDSDPPAVVRQKLEQGWRAVFDRAVFDSAVEWRPRETASLPEPYFAGRLLGFEFDSGEGLPAPNQDARGFYDQALIDLRSYLRALASTRPIVLLLEDLHWADDSSLELLKHIKDNLADLPLLLIAATRPALFEQKPDWGEEGRFHTRLNIQPLSKDDSFHLVREILQKVQNVPPALLELVASSADGNPFYIEELVKMLIEDGVIRVDGETWSVEDGLLSGLRVPPTLVGVLQARFDSLTLAERTQLQRGSVIGRIFWDQAVEYLAENRSPAGGPAPETPILDALRRLQAREMVFLREHSTFEETNEYLFKHALLRDVTYESLLKKQRRAYHQLAAQWLEAISDRIQRSDQFAGQIAGHFEQAGQTQAAAAWYWKAGQGAARRYANLEALHAFNRALELMPDEDVPQRFEILFARDAVYELLGRQAERSQNLDELSHLAQGLNSPLHQARSFLRQAAYSLSISDFPAAQQAAQEAGELAQANQSVAIEAESSLLLAGVLMRQGDFEASRASAQRALDLSRQQQMLSLQAGCQRHLGLVAYYLGKPQEAFQYFEQAHTLFTEIGDRRGQSMALNNMGGATFNSGDYTGAQLYYSRSLELSREIGDRLGEGRAYNNLGITAVESGEYAQAEANYLQALHICRAVGHRSFEVSSLDNLGNLAAFRYEYAKSQEYHTLALQLAREIGDKITESFVLFNLGHSFLLAGNSQSARAYLREAETLGQSLGDPEGECRVYISLSDYGVVFDELEMAFQYGQKALELARTNELLASEGQARHSLASALLIQGRLAEAGEQYRSAIQIYQETDEPRLSLDAQAGLAVALLALREPAEAQAQVDAILAFFQTEKIFGIERPVFVLLACSQVLTANHDPRAPEVLEQGYNLLQDIAAKFDDPRDRQLYLESIPAHRALLAAWQAHARSA